ncbi:MAG: PQQ-binding-like beta-propeller repeat protein [Planctomycetota bacterium]
MRFPLVLCSLFAMLAPLPAAQTGAPVAPSSSWPGFRGAGSGLTAASSLPVEWSEPAWIASTPGYGQSAPIVWGDRVVVTSIDGPKKELAYVTCLRLSDGQLLWSRSFRASTLIENTEMVSRGAPTPALDAERVYAFFESGDLLCLDHDGELVWRADLFRRFGPFEGNHGVGSSPVLAGNTVLLLLDHAGPSHLLAFDAESGADRWIVEREPRISWSTPALAASGSELIVSSNGFVEGYSVEDGRQLWVQDGIEGNTVPSPTVAGARVVVGQSKGSGLSLIERGADGAKLVWSGDDLSPSGFGSPLLLDDSILLVNRAGVLSSVDAADGALRWESRLACGGIWASPVSDSKLVWFFGKDGITSVVRWTADGPEEVAVNELESEGGVHGVAAVEGAFVVREPGRVLCLRTPEPETQPEPETREQE